MKTFLAFTLFIALSTITFGQKLKSDGFQVSFSSFEKQEIDYFGKKQQIYFGIVKVKSKDNQAGEYRFYLPVLDGEFTHLTLRNMDDIVLQPRVYYDADAHSFKYFIGTDNEKTEKVISDSSVKEIVLSGSIIWLKINK